MIRWYQPRINQPKHNFSNLDEISLQDLKFRPIIAQTGTYT